MAWGIKFHRDVAMANTVYTSLKGGRHQGGGEVMLIWRGEIRVTQRKRERHGGVLDRWRIGEGVGFVLKDGGARGCACVCVFIEGNNRKWVHVVSLRMK